MNKTNTNNDAARDAGQELKSMYDLCPDGDDLYWPGADEWYAKAGDYGNTYKSFLNEGSNWSKTLPEILAKIAAIRHDSNE